jgi:DNA-binding NarL/FixJ family response regulator
MALRILVVDDFEPWRRFVSLTFQKQKDLQILLEVSDGLEAVYRSADLRPDLVVLDIGLPTLNGIKAAQRIREVSPNSKILFLSEQNSPDMAEAALEAGGVGYVVKSDAGRELLAAVRAISEGKRYISTRFVGQVFFSTPDDDTSKHFSRHELQIYPNDAAFLEGFARFIGGDLNAGHAVVVIATETHRRGLFEKLQTQGFDLEALVRSGSYISFDVYDALSVFMPYDRPDPARLGDAVSRFLSTASKAPTGAIRRVTACGECAPLLWTEGKLDAALQVERLWDEVSHKYGLNTMCGYLSGTLQGEKGDRIFQKISSLHSTAVPYNCVAQFS